jgi:integrase
MLKNWEFAIHTWAKCSHPWHFSFKWKGVHYRFSLDRETGRRITSKTEAEGESDRLRQAIRTGTFRASSIADGAGSLSFADVATRYVDSYVRGRLRPRTGEQVAYHLGLLQRTTVPGPNATRLRFADRPIDAITKADIEAVRNARRPHGIVGTNRLLARMRHLFNWAIAEGYVTHTPFKREGVNVIKLEMGAEQPRHRRLELGEEERLLEQASAHLYALIVAALETGCRLGELLGLQWCDVRETDNVLLLPARKTKADEARDVPITSRLRAILEMRRLDQAGRPLGPEAFVFGNEIGEPVGSIKKAWQTLVLRAHGHTPQWEKNKNRLAPESLAVYGHIDLHFHDLRREFASRLREAPGISDHEVRDWLGHANITTTSRYLATTRTTLQQARRKFEQHRSRCTNVAQTAHLKTQPSSTETAATPHEINN